MIRTTPSAARKRVERAKKRAQGLVLRQCWIHPADWPALRARIYSALHKRASK